MVSDTRVQQFIDAVKIDCDEELNFEDAAKILNDIADYLLTLEKIWIRMQKKKDNLKNK